MANVLKMDKQTLIKQLLELGWSYRRIHRETCIHRDTIAKYDPKNPKWAKVPTDSFSKTYPYQSCPGAYDAVYPSEDKVT